jgi:hypothetical protein
MRVTTRSRFALVLAAALALCLLIYAPAPSAVRPTRPCRPIPVTAQRAQFITDSIARLHASGPDDPVWSGFASETAPVSFGPRCLTALALSWDGLHSGAIVIMDSLGVPVYADDQYRDVSRLVLAGDGRIGFRYNSIWGTGIWETRFIMLCALTVDVWEECLNVVLDKRTYVTGYPPDDRLAPRGASLEQTGSVNVVGDTVFLTRRVTLKRSDEAKPRLRNLGTVKLLLP